MKLTKFLLVISLLFNSVSLASDNMLRIGVLAIRGETATLDRWSPMAKYLSAQIKDHNFSIIPLHLEHLESSIKNDEVDFVITNTGNYVTNEAKYGISRIATLKSRNQEQSQTQFGAVVFTHHDRTDINSLSDLKGKSFMAVSENAFGGFQMAWRELKNKGIDPFEDFSEIRFSGFPQDGIVYAVRHGIVDAGTIRTGLLESMAAEDKINLESFKILNEQFVEGFPHILSTELYPEWPFAKTRKTPENIAQKVAIALLAITENSSTARQTAISGWTIPLDYQPVHELMKELNVGPYKHVGFLSFSDLISKYKTWIFSVLMGLVVLVIFTLYMVGLNRKLNKANNRLEIEVNERHKVEALFTRLGKIMDIASDHVFLFDTDNYKIRHANQTCISDLGYSMHELKKLSMLDIKRDISISQLDEILSPLKSGEKDEVSHETRHYRKDGTFIHVEGKIRLYMEGEKPVFAAISRDIGQRLQAEQSLLNENSKISNILENTGDAYFSLNNNFEFVYINAKTESLLNIKRANLLNKNIWNEIPELGSAFFKVFHRALLTNDATSTQGYYPPLNMWLEAKTYPVDKGVAVHMKDITEEYDNASNLRKSSKYLNTILNSISDAVVTINEQGTVISYNQSAQALFDYSEEEIIGNNINTLLPDHLWENQENIFAQVCKQGGTLIEAIERNIIGKSKHGTILNLKVKISNFLTGDDINIIAIMQEISQINAEIINLPGKKN